MELSSFKDTELPFSSKTDQELRKAYWLFNIMNNGSLVLIGTFLIKAAIWLRLPIRTLIKNTIFHQFCGGVKLESSLNVVNELAGYNIKSILDYGVEGNDTQKAFKKNLDEKLKIIKKSKEHADITALGCKLTGLIRQELLEKLDSNIELGEPEKLEYSDSIRLLNTICEAGHIAGTTIFFDAEETWIQNPIDVMCKEFMMIYNKSQTTVYNTYQMYCIGRLKALQDDIKEARNNGYKMGVKLVRGAYMEKERLRARQKGYSSPIHPNRNLVDIDFDRAIDCCLENLDIVSFWVATHNEESCLHLLNEIKERGIDRSHPNIIFAQLYGMGDHLSFHLGAEGYNVAKLVPYGPVGEVIPYLIRRAEENTSIAGHMSRELDLIKAEIVRRKSA